jgi:hypothetical protein
VTELHRAVRCYAHDGKLIDLLGGLQSAIDRLDALLARYAPADVDAAAASLAPCAMPAPAGSRAWTDALLGAIAIRNHLARALIAGAAAAAAAAPGAEPLQPGDDQESLLR